MQAAVRSKRGMRHGGDTCGSFPNVLFTQRTRCRRVPYLRPSPAFLCSERVSQLRQNRQRLPLCPRRSIARPSTHDCCLPAMDRDSTSHTAMLLSLPRPSVENTVPDYDFPADLEQSFISGALNSSSIVVPYVYPPTSPPENLIPAAFSPPISPHDRSTAFADEDFEVSAKHDPSGRGYGLKKSGVTSPPTSSGIARSDSDMRLALANGCDSCVPVFPDQYVELIAESVEEGLCAL